jgi:hypothetical protein
MQSPSNLEERRRFVFRRGVLGWGVTTAFLWAAFSALLLGSPFWRSLAIALVVFPIGGLFFGRALWCGQQNAEPAPPTDKLAS